MGSYVTITTMGGSDRWTVSNTTGRFGFAVLRSNRTASPDTVTASWTLNGQTTQVWNASMSLGDTKYWYIPNTDLLTIMNNTGQATMTMTASCGGETVTVTATIIIDPTVFYPDVTRWSSTIINTPLNGILVRGYSSVRYTFTAKKGQGASQVLVNFISSYGTFNPTGMNSRNDTLNGQTQFYVEGGSSDLTITTKIECRDSRGQKTDSMTSNATTWKGYTKPSITATAVRCDSNGTPDESGAYAKITFSATYSLTGLGNVGHVSMTTGGTTYTDPSAPVIVAQARATTTTYTIIATDTVLNSVSDSVTKKVTVNMAKFPLDLYDDGRGHFGARVGAIAEQDYFTCGLKQKGIYFYGTCATGRSTARKVCNDVDQTFQLYTGVLLYVKFTNANGKANPTLNVNGTGAIAIRRYGTTAPSTSRASSWNAGSVVAFIYDGSAWQMVGWLNTTYSAISEAEITNSASTTQRGITGQRFKQGLDYYMRTGTYVYSDTVSRAVDTFSFTDANMVGKTCIICSTQDSSQPVKSATLTSSTGAITVTLARAVHVVRINYLCF